MQNRAKFELFSGRLGKIGFRSQILRREILTPLKITANYCGMDFAVPFISSGFEPGEFGDDAVDAAAARFGKFLRGELSPNEYQI